MGYESGVLRRSPAEDINFGKVSGYTGFNPRGLMRALKE